MRTRAQAGRLAALGLIAALSMAVESTQISGTFDPAEPSCDDFCDLIVDKASGKTKGLGGQLGWAETDDQWCANHAVGTNPSVPADPAIGPNTAVPCNIPLLAGDTSCLEANRRLSQCKLKGSQVETQCAAYVQSKVVTRGQKIVLGLDIAATGMCTSACFAQVTGPFSGPLIMGCNIAGTSASAGEIIHTIATQRSFAKAAMSIGGAGAGLLFTGQGAAQAVRGGLGTTKHFLGSPLGPREGGFHHVEGMQVANGRGEKFNYFINDRGVVKYQEPGSLEFKTADPATTQSVAAQRQQEVASGAARRAESRASQEARNKKGKDLACKAAATFGALTGIRAFGMKQTVDTKKRACQAVRELVSSALAAGFRPLTNTAAATTGSSSSSGGAGGGAGGGAAGGAGGGAGGGGTANTGGTVTAGGSGGVTGNPVRTANGLLGGDPMDRYAQCLKDPTCSNASYSAASNSAAATDAGLLQQSGLGKLLRSEAAKLPMDEIERKIADGAGPEAFMSAALGGMGGSGFGKGIEGLAVAAFKEPSLLGGPSTTPASGGMLAQTGGAPAQEPQPMGLLGDQALGSPSTTAFEPAPQLLGTGPQCEPTDIYHTSCQGQPSIFQIVSGRITQSQDRVHRLPWALEINRMLAGQKQ